jgi:hypothetical protein
VDHDKPRSATHKPFAGLADLLKGTEE